MENDLSNTYQQRIEQLKRLKQVFNSSTIAPDIPVWQIEKTERFWYWSSRNGKTYKEITFWYDPIKMERKETTRQESIYDGEEYRLPDWCNVCQYRKSLNYE